MRLPTSVCGMTAKHAAPAPSLSDGAGRSGEGGVGPRYSAVVFDLGNVLVGWDPYLPLADLMSRDEWRRFAEASDFAALNALADLGVPLDEIIGRAAAKDVRHGELVARYFDRFEHSLTGPIDGVPEIVEELRRTGLRLLGLTNWSSVTFHLAPVAVPAIGVLEAVMVSGVEGVAKPDPAIFHRLIEANGLVAGESIFVDDSAANVEAAAALGFTAIRFTDATQLRRDLQTVGVLSGVRG